MNRYHLSLLVLLACSSAQADTLNSVIFSTDSAHKNLGQITFQDSDKGLVITPALTGLPPGPHGFHIHQQGNCGNAGMDAGSHYDPAKTDSHLGPLGAGHKGDLPVLIVAADGHTSGTLLAPHLTTADVKGLAVMIHAGGDNYSNQPPLGGGGARIACGVVESR
ncbi:superoxide dismutase family protein [Legionella sp. CNM-4043-24]|uniref:superoxide dismutase family protein n=1 Tax=Legionella sp. CNM-4043-24 TaxID=3421646 RepID=UPI00403A7E43